MQTFKKFYGIIGTDFSAYMDMPLAQQIWNLYRNRVVSHYLQENGIDVIPNVQWGDRGARTKRSTVTQNVGRGLAVVGGSTAAGYLIYRGVRMLPSLVPALWWTIPANLATP